MNPGHVQQLTDQIGWTIEMAYFIQVSCWTTWIL